MVFGYLSLFSSTQMGVVSSRQFRQALRNGDEDEALHFYHSRDDLKALNPSKSHGIINKTTPLHYAAKRGFARLFKEFLINGGNPNTENYKKQSVAHALCILPHSSNPSAAETRAEMLQFLITFCEDPLKVCPDSQKPLQPQLLNLNKQDRALNTPLHLAATSGLTKCVEILLSHNAAIQVENIAGQTPFDCAEVSRSDEIVAILEPKMVFAATKESTFLSLKPNALRQESYQGMREQELQEIKDTMVLQMTGLLGVSLSQAAALLQAFGWSQELLIGAWFENPQAACEQAKVKLPIGHQVSLTEGYAQQASIEERECEICTEMITEVTPLPCGHNFCLTCWKEYLELKIGEGKVAEIQCPGFDCTKVVPVEVVAKIIPQEVDAKYLKFGINAFVESNPSLRWCPHPGCGRAVYLENPPERADSGLAEAESSSQASGEGNQTPRSVDCGLGHFFCWACAADAHDPCNCELWLQWKELVATQDEVNFVSSAAQAAEQASSTAYVAAHSKPCPSCKVPIQKIDGCNHMTCGKCEHEFCWVCLGRWRIHGSRTGGYFDCNRYRAARNTAKQLEKAKESAKLLANKQQMKYFKHVYSRYVNHTRSLEYEESLLGQAKEKAAVLTSAAQESATKISPQEIDGQFVEDAIRELLKARLVLRSSYSMSYFISADAARDQLVKLLAPLEKKTEILAEMIARPHLRTPKDKIILATVESRDVRRKFLPAARKLNPPLPGSSLGPLDLEDEDLDPIHPESDSDIDSDPDDDEDWDSSWTGSD